MEAASTITLTKEHGYVMFVLIATVFHYLIVGFSVGGARRKTFSEEYMQKNFGEIHKKQYGKPAPKLGYPDMGNGRYSEKLSYQEWYEFQNAQRAHYNYLEQIPLVIVFELIAGVIYPIWTVYFGAAYIVGRVLYTIGYKAQGPGGRLVGAIILDLALVALLVLSIGSAYRIAF